MFNFGENYHRLEDGAASGLSRDSQPENRASVNAESEVTEREDVSNEGTESTGDSEKKPLKFRILDTQGRTYHLSAPDGLDSTISSVKDLLVDVAGVQKELQRLIFHGRLLEDSKTLADYHVEEDNVVHLFARTAVPTYAPRTASANSGQPSGAQGSPARVPRAVVVRDPHANPAAAEFLGAPTTFAQADFPLLQSSRRVRFLSAFLFLICSMQVMAILALFASMWDQKSNGSSSASSDNENGSNQPHDHKFGVADYVLMVINMFGMAVGILGMRGSQTFNIQTVNSYFKGLLFTGIASMLMKTYFVFQIASEVMNGTYPGMNTNSTTAASSNGNDQGSHTGDLSDSSSTGEDQKSELTGADILSDALFSTTIAALMWVFCFYRAMQFRNHLRNSQRIAATRDAINLA